jgi:methylenetetrahydrofolate dehydrogenase (NADP+)/methenyltetrahydrofolate cyclohydrolase
VLVGDHEPSRVYVAAKELACAEVGIRTRRLALPADASVPDVAFAVQTLNDDPDVDGVLLQVWCTWEHRRLLYSPPAGIATSQLPLPGHLKDATPVFKSMIAAHKDVDGFHASNIGALVLVGRRARVS